jgi:hypothetical protein
MADAIYARPGLWWAWYPQTGQFTVNEEMRKFLGLLHNSYNFHECRTWVPDSHYEAVMRAMDGLIDSRYVEVSFPIRTDSGEHPVIACGTMHRCEPGDPFCSNCTGGKCSVVVGRTSLVCAVTGKIIAVVLMFGQQLLDLASVTCLV